MVVHTFNPQHLGGRGKPGLHSETGLKSKNQIITFSFTHTHTHTVNQTKNNNKKAKIKSSTQQIWFWLPNSIDCLSPMRKLKD